MRIGYLLSLTSLFLFSLALTGCNTASEPSLPLPASNATGGHDHDDHDDHDHGHGDHGDHGDHDHGHGDHGDEDIDPNVIAVNLAKLSDEDRLLAEKQEICVVGGEALGSMGAPQKLDVDGTAIFICCRACEREILTNKEKYIALVKGTESEESDDPDDGSDEESDAGDSTE